MDFTFFLNHLFNQPVLMDEYCVPGLLHQFTSNFVINGERFELRLPNRVDENRPYQVVNGVAVIPIQGSLLHNFNYRSQYATGYNQIRADIEVALADKTVKGIAGLFSSSGGHVDGVFDLADYIYQAQQSKPFHAIIDPDANSAAFLLASSFTKRTLSRTARAGSNGVIYMHIDQSAMLKSSGVEVTLFTAGKGKADGNPYEKLSLEVKTKIQARIDYMHELQLATLSRNLSMPIEQLREIGAEVFSGQQAVDVGFADAVMPPNEALAAFTDELSSADRTTTIGVIKMSIETEKPGADQPDSQKLIVSAKTRIKSILASEEAKGREALAEYFAYDTEMSAADVLIALAKAPSAKAEEKPTAQSPLDKAMSGTKQPNIESDAADDQAEDLNDFDQMLADFELIHGKEA